MAMYFLLSIRFCMKASGTSITTAPLYFSASIMKFSTMNSVDTVGELASYLEM